MAKHEISIFATAADLKALMRSVEAQRVLQFAVAGIFEIDHVHIINSLAEEVHLDGAVFLGADRGCNFATRAIPQRSGGNRFAVDQVRNPKTVVLRIGRMIGENTLVAGQIGTSSNEPESLRLFAFIKGELQKQFNKVKSYWLGPEASLLLDRGVRLTANPKAPRDYDLSRK